MIRPSDGGWELAARVADVASRRPDTVRQLIDIQIDRLKSNEQRILEAASLVGVQFTARSVAHALETPADEVDTVCEGLVNDKRLLRFVTSEAWPDGSIQSHYAFVHALYRDTALERVPPATRRLWHRRIAGGAGSRLRCVRPPLLRRRDRAAVGKSTFMTAANAALRPEAPRESGRIPGPP